MGVSEEKVGKSSVKRSSDRKRTKPVKKRTIRKTAKDEPVGDVEDRGVVYLSHIPHGFYEPQMRHFFSQFGNVNRLKLWRSKKSGKSRGFAYIEFEYAEVAKIVADTMNNYLMYQKLMKCQFIPNDGLCSGAFTHCERKFLKPYHRKQAVKRHNSLLQADTLHIVNAQRRLVQVEEKRRKKMAKLGIECNLPGYKAEWEEIKKARAIVDEQKRVERLREKALEVKRQEALKKARQRVKLLSKKRRANKRLKLIEEKKTAKAEQEASGSKSPDDGSPQGDSPKRKSSAVSVGEGEEPPRKRRGKVSTPKSADPAMASKPESTPSKSKAQTPSGTGKASGKERPLLRSGKKSKVSPAVKTISKTPKGISATPKGAIATPKSSLGSAKKFKATPKTGTVTPKKTTDATKKAVATPKQVTATPKVVTATPKAVTSTPKMVKATPKSVKATPKAVKATPKAVTATPKAVKATPKGVTTTPKAVKATPKAVKATPKAVKATPKAVKATPKAVTATPKSSAVTPKSLKATPSSRLTKGAKTPKSEKKVKMEEEALPSYGITSAQSSPAEDFTIKEFAGIERSSAKKASSSMKKTAGKKQKDIKLRGDQIVLF